MEAQEVKPLESSEPDNLSSIETECLIKNKRLLGIKSCFQNYDLSDFYIIFLKTFDHLLDAIDEDGELHLAFILKGRTIKIFIA